MKIIKNLTRRLQPACLTGVITAFLAMPISCQPMQEGITITGTTEGIPNQEIDLVLDMYGQSELLQSTKIIDGKFEFKTILEKPASALSIKFKDEKYVLNPTILENTPLGMMLVDNGYPVEITIKVDTAKLKKGVEYIYPEVSVQNESPSYKSYSKFREKLNKKFMARRIELDSMFFNLNIDWSNFKLENLDPETQEKLKSVQNGNVKLANDKVDYLKASLAENSNNIEGIFTLYEFGTFMVLDYQHRELWPKWYSDLKANVKEIHLAQAFKKGIEKNKQTKTKSEQVSLGKPFKDFILPDQNGKEVTLSSFLDNGNYVLLDFWASWCGPCRKENPNLLKAYNKYKNKGLVIIAVSLDESKKAWLKAIKEDGMPWVHLSDLLGYKGKVAEEYGIRGIPANFLLNSEGEIVALNLRDEELHTTLDKIFKNK